MGRRLRVLDVGLGRGVQSLRLARAGHEVTGLEADPDLRALVEEKLADEPEGIRQRVTVVPAGGQDTGAHFLPGAFDVVLCHGELMEAPDPSTTLAGLVRVLDAGGLLSLLIRNDDALAMRPARAGDWDAALAALDFPERAGRAFRLESLSAMLAGIGTPLRQWYGVQVFDGLAGAEGSAGAAPAGPAPAAGAPAARDGAADGPESPSGTAAAVLELPRMLAVEERAARTDPYRSIAAMLHLCAVRGG